MSLETMTKLSTYTVTAAGGDSTIVFTNIPQMYTDLYIVLSLRSLYNGWADGYLRFGNGGTTEYKTFKSDIPSGSSTETYTVGPTGDFSPYSLGGPNLTANHFSNATIYIPNYTSGSFKTFTSEYSSVNSTDDCRVGHATGIWSNTSPITTATFSVASGFAQYSSVTLYGVKAMRTAVGNGGAAFGGSYNFDGTYFYHTFTSTDTFVVTKPLTVDYLVVAGGGGAGQAPGSGSNYGTGGGGAGGFRTSAGQSGGGASAESKLYLLPTSYAVAIGAGGAAGSTPGATNGSNSSFSTITSIGGGAGFYSTANVSTGGVGAGGSGGGNSYDTYSGYSYGAGTANQGYNGGTGNTAGTTAGSGGGAGGAGGVDSNGGVGVQSSISGTATYYAGGGAAGSTTARTGGSGGGGNQNTSGLVNTGGGGGGKYGFGTASTSSGAGGSGIVIIRYKR